MSDPILSVIVPSMGKDDFLRCLTDSLKRTRRPGTYELCVGLDLAALHMPMAEALWRDDMPISYAFSKTPGMSAAVNTAARLAKGEWFAFVADDMVFLPGWDDFGWKEDDTFLSQNRVLCFELLEPIAGSFPPAVLAGESPAEFDISTALAASQVRRVQSSGFWTGTGPRAVPGRFFVGACVLHRSRWVPWPEHADPYSYNDIGWMMDLHDAHPDVAFGRMPGNCLYHFVRGSVKAFGIQAPAETAQRFHSHYGLTIQEAYNQIYRRSELIWARSS